MEYGTIRIMRFIVFVFVLFINFSVQAENKVIEGYYPSDHASLSKLLWKFGYYNQDSDDAIDAFFQLSECDLYKTYYKNDFEWKNIRESFAREMQYFAKEIPNTYYINAFIPLGRYNFEKSAFEIDDEYKLNNAGTIKVPFYTKPPQECGGTNIKADLYPHIIKFFADNKFALSHIPVPPNEAEGLIKRIGEFQYSEKNGDNRIVPVRFKIKMRDVKEFNFGTFPEVTFEGFLVEIEFFEDPQMTQLIWRRRFRGLE